MSNSTSSSGSLLLNHPQQNFYPQTNSLVFVVNPLPSTEEQLNERFDPFFLYLLCLSIFFAFCFLI